MSYAMKNLDDVGGSAPGFGVEQVQEARFANQDLETERTGLSLQRIKPHRRQRFAHTHDPDDGFATIDSGEFWGA